MNRDLKFIKSPHKIRCHCNDENCFKNKTCETDGFCYQNLVLQTKNGRTIKKSLKGCSSNRHVDFYYCNHFSNQTNFICCNHNYCNNLPVTKFKLNIRENFYFILFFLLLIVLIVLIVILIRKCCEKKQKKAKKISDIEQGELNKPKLRDQLEFIRLINKGKFKQTYYGRRLGEKLFIKQFNEKAKENWLNEIEVYSLPLLRHENIVDFVGKDYLLIATIYYENGSLTDYLKQNRNLNEYQLIELMLSASIGLNHLHYDLECKPSIAHRNLNSDHFIVVVNSESKCKLANFSTALTYTRYERMEKEHNLKKLKTIVCDPKYCPSEYFNQTINLKKFNSFLNADIYSFSLVLWQIANHHLDQSEDVVNNQENDLNQENNEENQTKANEDSPEFRYSKPFEEYFYDDCKTEYDQMKELLKDDLNENSFINRPTIYFDASKIKSFNGYVITKLIEECWSPESNARLSISRIVKELTDLYNNQRTNKTN